MSILTLLFVIVVVGLLLSLFAQLPMPAPYKNVVYILVTILLVLWLFENLGAIGPWHYRR